MKKNHVGFMEDDTIYQTHMEESHMADALNNLDNAVTLDATNLTNLTITKSKLSEQLKVELYQNKVLTDLLNKMICGVTSV